MTKGSRRLSIAAGPRSGWTSNRTLVDGMTDYVRQAKQEDLIKLFWSKTLMMGPTIYNIFENKTT